MSFNPDNALPSRFYSHACLGLASKVDLPASADAQSGVYTHKPNLIEKAGNSILWVVGSIPRSIKWVGRQFQDPRVVTIALTALAMLAVTLCFYPVATAAAITAGAIAVKALVASIPVWGVKLSAYVLTCSTILGSGLRAGGRFANSSLMKAFYNLPQSFQGNPSNLTIEEIKAARNQAAQAS